MPRVVRESGGPRGVEKAMPASQIGIWVLLSGLSIGGLIWAALDVGLDPVTDTDVDADVATAVAAGGSGQTAMWHGTGPGVKPGALPGGEDAAAAGPVRTPNEIGARVVRIVHAETCEPIAGAQLFAMSGAAEILGSRTSDAQGVVRGLSAWPRTYAVVAWHPGFQIFGEVVRSSRVELALVPVRNLVIRIEPRHALAEEWLSTCAQSVNFRFEIQGNPVSRTKGWFEYRLYGQLGLNVQVWPLRAGTSVIPRYLRADGTVIFTTDPKLPARLVSNVSTLAAVHATTRRKLDRMRQRSNRRIAVPSVQDEVVIVPDPVLANALILRYTRRAGDVGELWLLVQGADRRPVRSLASFASRRGIATFKIFDLAAATYTPTLVFMVNGKWVRFLECHSVAVKGRTDVELLPRDVARLTVRVAGASASTTVALVSKLAVDIDARSAVDPVNHAHTWSQLSPGRYEVFARSAGQVSRRAAIVLGDGGWETVDLRLRPACVVTLVVKKNMMGREFRVRETATGHERRFASSELARETVVDDAGDAIFELTSKGRELELPFGTYAFSVRGGGSTSRRAVVLDTPKQRVALY